jgi:6-phosphofructokinase
VYLGRQAPGANNVVDGLIRFKEQQSNVDLYGFINGVDGLMKGHYVEMTKDTFKNYVNLGGIDYIGRGADKLRDDHEQVAAAEICKKLGLTGLILVGATDAMTDAAYLS